MTAVVPPTRSRPSWRTVGAGVIGHGTRERLRRLPAPWPLTLCIAGFPVWWALGLGAFIWPILAVPMAVRLVTRRRRIVLPIGFGTWLLFLVIVPLSYTGLQNDGLPVSPLYRLAVYVSCTIFFLFVCAADEDEMPGHLVVRLLAGFWIVTVIGGWLGVLMPTGGLPSLTERLLPAGLAGNEFMQVLIRPEFAQVQNVLGYPLGRPKAPFLYTNDWGSMYSLLLPFFFLSWLQSPDPRRRSWAYILLTASLVPVFVSLNRGMWLSLGVALVYGASRSGEVARMARKALATLVVVGLLVIVFTPVGGIVEGRAANDHSSQGRGVLYVESVKLAAEHPLIGVGSPRPYEGNRIIPLVGTQGLLWNLMVSTGFVGLGLVLATWGRWIWETRTGPPITFWCHVALIVGLVQIAVYDMVPAALHVVFVAAALGFRAARHDEPETEPETDETDPTTTTTATSTTSPALTGATP